MCILAAKYFPQLKSFAACKNRDRNYTVNINFRKSMRDDIERLYIWDEKTRYTEGLNENGVCIVSASLLTKNDEREHTKGEDERDYYSPDGKKIRDALLCPTPKEAVDYLLDVELSGNTLVFTSDIMYCIEAVKDVENDKFISKVKQIGKDEIVCKTNHGVWLPNAGYQRGIDEDQTASRISSESRLMIATKMTELAKSPMDLMNRLTYHELPEPQLNPCRLDERPSKLRTTGQLMLIPAQKTLYYRPIMCDITFDYWRLNKPESRTFFELVGMREIITADSDKHDN
jgi:hypothetical protein